MRASSFIFTGILLFYLLISCKEKKVSIGNIHFEKNEDIHYGNDAEQVMDLYLPYGNPSQKRDVFIIIHGGGWRAGNKSQLTFFTLSLMKKFPDHIFANINYRLASETTYALPYQIDDIKAASAFLEKKLHYSPQIILLGNSAGGHLSMLYAYQSGALKKVKAVINIVGPADLSDSSFRNYQEYSFVERRLVDPHSLKPGISHLNSANPIYWIGEDSPPTLSYYGVTDHVVPLRQGVILDSVLNRNKVLHKTYEFRGGHLDWDHSPHDGFLIDKIDLFLKQMDIK